MLNTEQFVNVYEDSKRADAYATLEFARTYHLAYRDLPAIFRRHTTGTAALDFGCGTGRSTRFVRQCGFDVTGIDISPQMIAKAQEIDPAGDYRLIDDGDFSGMQGRTFDLILSAFTFDNIPTLANKVSLFSSLGALLKSSGVLVNVVSSPEIYFHEWASFSTKDFVSANRAAKAGDIVRIVTTDYPDSRPVEDIIWPDEAYRDVYTRTGLEVTAVHKPLATGQEPWPWVNETQIAPWVIYVLRRR